MNDDAASARRTLEVLRSVEWAVETGPPGVPRCPTCFAPQSNGHSMTCALAAEIAAHEKMAGA